MELYLKCSMVLLALAWMANIVNLCNNAANKDRPGVIVNFLAGTAQAGVIVFGAYLLHRMY